MGGQKAVVSSDIIIYIFPENDKSNGSVNTNIPRQMTFKYRASNVHITIMQISILRLTVTQSMFLRNSIFQFVTRCKCFTANIEIVNINYFLFLELQNTIFFSSKNIKIHLRKFNSPSINGKDILTSRPVTPENTSQVASLRCMENIKIIFQVQSGSLKVNT